MPKLSPSILAADFANLEKEIKSVDKAGADYIHLDVMDGVFVPNLSFGIPVIKSIRPRTRRFFDVHLMIINPEKYIRKFAETGADGITFHLEATKDPMKCIDLIEKADCSPGIAISPETPVSALSDELLRRLDMVLVMTVHPGFGGQTYIESCTEKISEARDRIRKLKLKCDIEVDGGIMKDNIRTVLDAGATVIVMGSSIFKGDISANVKYYRDVFKKYK